MTLAVEHDKIWYGRGAPASERRTISAETDLRVPPDYRRCGISCPWRSPAPARSARGSKRRLDLADHAQHVLGGDLGYRHRAQRGAVSFEGAVPLIFMLGGQGQACRR
jgi:hypothetical protein